MKLSKKKKAEIGRCTNIIYLIKEFECKIFDSKSYGESHWTDYPPEMWQDDERALFDFVTELEYKIKDNVINIIEKTKQNETKNKI